MIVIRGTLENNTQLYSPCIKWAIAALCIIIILYESNLILFSGYISLLLNLLVYHRFHFVLYFSIVFDCYTSISDVISDIIISWELKNIRLITWCIWVIYNAVCIINNSMQYVTAFFFLYLCFFRSSTMYKVRGAVIVKNATSTIKRTTAQIVWPITGEVEAML